MNSCYEMIGYLCFHTRAKFLLWCTCMTLLVMFWVGAQIWIANTHLRRKKEIVELFDRIKKQEMNQ